MNEPRQSTESKQQYWFPVLESPKLDFQNKEKEGKSLAKSDSLFNNYFGYALKTTKKGGDAPKKEYFLQKHPVEAYFAYQICALLELNVPKARIAKNPGSGIGTRVATRGIDFIDLIAVLNKEDIRKRFNEDVQHHEDIKRLEKLSQLYSLDIENQLLISKQDGKKFKIDSDAFGSFIVAILLNDHDFVSGNYTNFGFTQVGERFVATLIDKQYANFDGRSYAEHMKNCSRFIKGSGERYVDEITIFDVSKYPDQYLSLVDRISQALVVSPDSKQCPFDKIFNNSRVQATPELKDQAETMCENFKKTAQSVVAKFKDALVGFKERETLRNKIAEAVIKELKDVVNPNDVAKTIIKDLRGPYYKAFFANKEYISDKDLEDKKLQDELLKDIRSVLKPHVPPPAEDSDEPILPQCVKTKGIKR